MQDEASTVVSVCRKECLRAGVNFGDGAQLTAEELAETDEDEPAASAPPPPALTPPPAPAAPAQPPAPAPAPAMPAVQIPPAPFNAPTSRFSPSSHDAKAQKQTKVGTGMLHTSFSSISGGPMPTMSGPMAPAPSLLSPKPTAAASPKEADAASRRPVMAPVPSAEHPDPTFLIKPPVAASAQGLTSAGSAASGTPIASRSHIPRPSSATPATPAAGVATPRDRAAVRPMTRASTSASSFATPPTSSGGASDPGSRPMNTPAMNGRHTPAASSSAAKPPRPSSAPLTARASTTAPLGKDRPSTAVTPPVQPAKLPSYAKPTAAHKARVLKEDSDLPSTSSPTPPITFASTNKPLRRIQYMAPRATSSPEEKKEPKKPVFDNIRSNLLRPTAAFLAWTAGKSKSIKESDLRSSQNLTGEGSGPVGRARAPNSAPPKGATMREFSATTVSALSPSLTQQGSTKIATTPEPFRLASAERHQKAQEELARKKEEKARLESQIPKFRASPMPNSVERLGSSGSKTDTRRAAVVQTDA
ncbi:hypothetical protein PLESTF_000450400 [Pleodorina starrii]|nr:hypothetical protein PLESTF_000450400 [Pleodorina starrii]